MDILGQSSLLLAVMSFGLGFSVLARNVRNKLFIAFAIACTVVFAWSLFFFLDKIWPDRGFYRFHLIFNIWLAPAVLAFIRVFVRIQNDTFSRRLLDVSIVTAVPLSAAMVFRMETYPGVLELVEFIPALIGLQIIELTWIDQRLHQGAKRIPKLPVVGLSRRNLIYLGVLVILCLCTMDHLPVLGHNLPAVGNLTLGAYLFFVSQAISQQRLLNFGALLSRFLVLMAVALTLTGVYSLLVAWIQNSPGLFFLNSFIA